MSKLKVTSVRYFETRRGLGYQAKTNVDGVEIWNDGMGGCTFLEGENIHKYKHLDWDGEDGMDKLIDEFEEGNPTWKVAHVVDEDGHLNVYITKGKKDNIITISTGQGDGDNGEQYALRFTTTNIEENENSKTT